MTLYLFLQTNRKDTIQDIVVPNKFSVGSDHRMIRAKVCFDIEKERTKMVLKNNKRKWIPPENTILYKEVINKNLRNHRKAEGMDIEQMNNNIVEILREAEKECCPNVKKNNDKLSQSTKKLLDERRNLRDKYDYNFTALKSLNKEIHRGIRHDVRQYNAREISRVIEENKSLKVLKQNMSAGRKNIHKLKNKQGQTINDREKILEVVEAFYRELYGEQVQHVDNRPLLKVTNQGSEEMPDITPNEVRKALQAMKNNKSPGEDGIVTEAIKLAGSGLLGALARLFNKCLSEATTPTQWNNAEIILLHKKRDIEDLKNYRPISLLSHIYKLFTRIIANRLDNKLPIAGTGRVQSWIWYKRSFTGVKKSNRKIY